MKIALGMITKSLDSDSELLGFIENAEKYGHRLDCVIVAYALNYDPRIAKRINDKVPLHAVDIRRPEYAIEQFRRLEMSGTAGKTLLECPIDTSRGMVPYGFNRTVVTIEAILRGVDILFFVDYDVSPAVLKMTPGGPVVEDVDFFGAHLEHLNSGAQITTGEYSGYNILPPAEFDGMEDLLQGLQKSEMLEYWQNSAAHRCLAVQPPVRKPKPCTKVLGGNTAIRLSAFSDLPPFFSSHYKQQGELFLCRGEDTVLGLGIAKSGTVCTDIDLNPLHDTFKDYPAEPDLRGNPAIQNRFYYACTGWVGRNPFLNYMLNTDLASAREFQREKLGRGLHSLAKYTSNPKYLGILANFDESWSSLTRYADEFERTLEAWDEFKNRSGIR